MHFYYLRVQNLVLKIDLVNRRWAVYLRAYGMLHNIDNGPKWFFVESTLTSECLTLSGA